jgi:lipopolysaccharide export system protein LptA
MSRILKFVCFFSFLISTCTFALPEDSEEPLYIVADTYALNYKTGFDSYEGHVKVDQGTTHLIADKVVTQKDSNHKIISAIAYGILTFAEYTTLPNKEDPILYAKAKTITFYPPTSIVILEENVIVTQGENSVKGPLIVYNMKDQTVKAPPSKNGRSTIMIEPKYLKS